MHKYIKVNLKDLKEPNFKNLRGQPFLGKTEYGLSRKCSLCFYRDREGNFIRDCEIGTKDDPTPKELFGFRNDQYLPERIDGK